MEEGIESFDQLISLLSERDEVNAEYTAAIADILQPTALAALQELLQAKDHQIECSDIHFAIEDLALHITCDVTYGPNDPIPEFVVAIAPAQETEAGQQLRSVRIGIPIAYSTRPKQEILEFLQQLVKENLQGTSAPDTTTVKIQPTEQFDLSELSKDQIAQLLVFQHTAGGKH